MLPSEKPNWRLLPEYVWNEPVNYDHFPRRSNDLWTIEYRNWLLPE